MGDTVFSNVTSPLLNGSPTSFHNQQYNCENLSKDESEQWLKHLILEETSTQEKRLNNCVAPFLAIPTTVVEIIFYICEEFQQTCEVRYLTVELFDRFINNQFRILVPKIWETNINSHTFDSCNWKEISYRIKNQALLRIMSCLAIASKFVLFNKVVPMKKIQEFLNKCGLTFSMETIRASEMRVFKVLDYKLHFPIVLTHADLLVELMDIPKDSGEKKLLRKLSTKVIDVAYLYHQEIYHKLFYNSTGRWEKTNEERKEFHATECNNLFLAAAVIVTTLTIIHPHNIALSNQMATKLDSLTNIPSDDIVALSSIITMIILT